MIKIKNPYLQFVFIEDLDQIYENELSEALKIKQERNQNILKVQGEQHK